MQETFYIIPYEIDNTPYTGEFEYYLLGSHWITADIAKNDYKTNALCNAIYSATGKTSPNNAINKTYINNVNITVVKDNNIVYAPVNIKKYKVPLIAAVILLVLVLVIIGTVRSNGNNKPESGSDASITVIEPEESKENTIESETAVTTEAQPVNSDIDVVPSDIMPYEYHNAEILYNDFEKSVTVAGAEYNTAVVFNSNHSNNQVMFNIGGEYKKMYFSADCVDGSDYEKDVTVRFRFDGVEQQPIKIVKAALPEGYEYDVTGVKHIKIAADYTSFSPQIAFTDFYLTK